MTDIKFEPKDYKSDQYVRWCPGCGDHAVLNCLHKAMAEVGVAPHNMAVSVSLLRNIVQPVPSAFATAKR